MTKLDLACPASGDVATSGVLSIPPMIYREYAAELRELARTAATNSSRALYLKMANAWAYAAVRFEAGVVEPKSELSFFHFLTLSHFSFAGGPGEGSITAPRRAGCKRRAGTWHRNPP